MTYSLSEIHFQLKCTELHRILHLKHLAEVIPVHIGSGVANGKLEQLDAVRSAIAAEDPGTEGTLYAVLHLAVDQAWLYLASRLLHRLQFSISRSFPQAIFSILAHGHPVPVHCAPACTPQPKQTAAPLSWQLWALQHSVW